MKIKRAKGSDKFEADGDVPRFVKLKDDMILYRNPVTGFNERINKDEARAKLEVLVTHPLYKKFVKDLQAVA